MQARSYLISPCLAFWSLLSRGLTSKLLFLPPVLFDSRSASVGTRAGDLGGGRRYRYSSCNLNVVSWHNTLLAIFQPPDLPPFIACGIVKNHDLVSETDSNLVVALRHKVK
jgi:hypothetical protein